MINEDTDVNETMSAEASVSTDELASSVDSIEPEPIEAVEAAPVDTVDATAASADAEPASEPASEPVSSDNFEPVSFDPLTSELPEVEEMEHDGFYDDLNPEHIKDLPPVARRMLHNFRVAYEKNNAKLQEVIASKEAESAQRQQKLEQMERDFARRQAEFYALIDDPKVRETLSVPEEELPDPLSPEGIQARIDRGVAQGMSRVLEPLHQAADRKIKQSAYLDFVDKHPEMRDPTFKNEVLKLVRGRQEAGQAIDTQDAYQLVKAQQVLAERQARQAQEQRARANAARRVSRTSASGSPGIEGVPADVKRKGANAIRLWLENNPEAARKISSEFRH